jgi:hypothetical protein
MVGLPSVPGSQKRGTLRQAQGRLGGTLGVDWRSHRDRGHPPVGQSARAAAHLLWEWLKAVSIADLALFLANSL